MQRCDLRYELVDDPDRESGLLVPGYILRMTGGEVNEMLLMGVFTPGSVLRKAGRTYRVEWGKGRKQVLT